MKNTLVYPGVSLAAWPIMSAFSAALCTLVPISQLTQWSGVQSAGHSHTERRSSTSSTSTASRSSWHPQLWQDCWARLSSPELEGEDKIWCTASERMNCVESCRLRRPWSAASFVRSDLRPSRRGYTPYMQYANSAASSHNFWWHKRLWKLGHCVSW